MYINSKSILFLALFIFLRSLLKGEPKHIKRVVLLYMHKTIDLFYASHIIDIKAKEYVYSD